jgi:hypothetical protein
VIDIGPGAGDEGGMLVAARTPSTVAKSINSRTAAYLARFLNGGKQRPRDPGVREITPAAATVRRQSTSPNR